MPVFRLNYIPLQDAAQPETEKESENAKSKRKIVEKLRLRDGDFCFYCHALMLREEMTVEHLLPKHLKASDSALNMVLAHKICNEQAGNSSIAEKIRLRERNMISLLLRMKSDLERLRFLTEIRLMR